MTRFTLIFIVVLAVIGLATPASAQHNNIIIWGTVTDFDGNALSGMNHGVAMKLWARYGSTQKPNWQLIAETACDRWGNGNGCPNENGYYQFTFGKWGNDLYPGRYAIEVGSETYGWARREFNAKGQSATDFSLDPNLVDVYLDWGKSKVEGGMLSLYYWTYSYRYDFDLPAYRKAIVVVQAEGNEEEELLPVVRDKGHSYVMVKQGQTYRVWNVAVPELEKVQPGRRVCIDLSLMYTGWDKYRLGKSQDPVCMVKTMQQGGWLMLPIR